MSSKLFERAFEAMLTNEGGYIVHKNKGESTITYAGIYKKAHPEWPGWNFIAQGQLDQAKRIVPGFYFNNYWNPITNTKYSDEVNFFLFDQAVNSGVQTSVRLAQKAARVSSDGIAGAITSKAIAAMDTELFICRFSLCQIKRYNSLARRKRYARFLRGWLNRVFNNLGGIL